MRSGIFCTLLLACLGGWEGIGVTLSAHAEATVETTEPRPRSTPRVDRSVMEYRSTLRVYDVDIDSRFRPVGSREPETVLPDFDYRATPSQPSESALTDLPSARMPVRRAPDPDSDEDTGESGWGWLAAEVAKARESTRSDTEQNDVNDEDRLREQATPHNERNLFEEDQRVFRQNDGFFISTELQTDTAMSPDGSFSLEEGAALVTGETWDGVDMTSPVVYLPESLRDDPIAQLFRLDTERDPRSLTFAETTSRTEENRFRPPDSPTMAARTLTGEQRERTRLSTSSTDFWAGGQRGEDNDLTRGYQPGMFDAQDSLEPGFRAGSTPFDSVGSMGATTDRGDAFGFHQSPAISGMSPARAGGAQSGGLTPLNQESRIGFGQIDSSSRSFDDSIRQPSALPW